MGYRIGLDIGIASVGWAVIENDSEGNPKRIIDLGSRIFDAAENPKDGSALAKVRRDARGIRRRTRRKKHRIERTLNLLEKYNILSKKDWYSMFENYRFQFNVYELREKALDEKITNKDLARILVNFVKRRGYQSNSKSEENTSSNDLGKLLKATQENKSIMKNKGYRTIGEMYLNDDRFKFKDMNGDYILDRDGNKILKVRNSTDDYKSTALRSLVLDEIKKILTKQKEFNSNITESFINEYISIFMSQRNFDDGPGEPSPYAGNQIEKMLGFCTFEKEEKRAPKATYTFEYFKLLQDLNHIKIESIQINEGAKNKTKRELSLEEKKSIVELIKSKAKITYYDIRKCLDLMDNQRFNMFTYTNILEWNDKTNSEVEKKQNFKEFESYNKIKTALNRVEKNYISKLSIDDLDNIGYALTVYKNDNKRISFLKETSPNLSDDAINELLNLSFTKVGNLSIKAMKKIIPELEKGLTYDKAVNNVYEDFRGVINTEKKRKLNLKDLEEEISNPVVRRGISQAIKVLNAITLRYNLKYGKPDIVVIEVAREMSKNFSDRNLIKKSQEKNMQNNERLKEKILEYKNNPKGQDIVKLKLWEEQDGICLYSGKKIPLEMLFTEAVDVDHIIPYSICFDDSYNNKVLVLASENRQKGNRVPYKYQKDIGRDTEEYTIRVNNYIKNPRKKAKLLRESFSREDISDWKQRNIQDTQYICRLMYNLVRNNLEFSNNKNFERKVWTVNGSVTAHIRKRLGIEKTRDGDIHHAIDAVVIAITTQGMINKLTKYYQYQDGKFMYNNGEYVDIETGELLSAKQYEEINGINFPEPWHKFRKELEIRTLCPTKDLMIKYLHNEKIFTYENYDDVEPIFVSRMPKRKVTGAAHLDTIRGFEKREKEIYTMTKTELTKLKLGKDGEIEGYPEKNKRDDMLLYNALKNQLKKFNNNGEKAFKEAFYKPKKDGSKGPLVKKVQIEKKTTLGVELEKNKGFAANGDSVRIDVFYIEGEGYYFVPIYVSDTIKDNLPNKACVANKPYSEWKEMDDKDFIFSLYPKDLIYIKGKNKIKLNPNNKNDDQIEVEETFAYYIKAGISVAQIAIQTHDNKYSQSSLGIKSLLQIKKYDVDVLGNYHEVKLPEKRMPFNIKK